MFGFFSETSVGVSVVYVGSSPFLRVPTKYLKDSLIRISDISNIEWDDEESCYCIYLTDDSCCNTTASLDDLLIAFDRLGGK